MTQNGRHAGAVGAPQAGRLSAMAMAAVYEAWASYWEGYEWDSDSYLTDERLADVLAFMAMGCTVEDAVQYVADAQ